MASISSRNSDLLPSWPSEKARNSLRDVSFSSYLNNSEESYIRTLVESNQILEKSKVEDGEIDVFSADKYFNGEKTQAKVGSISTEIKKPDHLLRQEVVYQPQTPSNQSESSSWNSQSVLLKRVPRIPSRKSSDSSKYKNRNKGKIQGNRLFLSCCYCTGKTSEDVAEEMIMSQIKRDFDIRSIKTNLEISEITRLNKLRLEKETHNPFFFPQTGSDSHVSARNLIIDAITEQTDEEKRESLDVFGSNEFEEYGIVERRLNMLSWDAIPRVKTEDIINNVSASGRHTESYKDTESDASSDLFEIECLSCTTNPVVGSTSPTTCYAPSEASIEWSVVTASAADFSAFSDCEDQRSSITSVSKCRKNPPKLSSSYKMNGMLLGCTSQKAVKVAGDHVYRTPVRDKLEKERRPRNSDSAMAMTRFQSEAKLVGFGQKPTKEMPLVYPRPPRRSVPSPASDLLRF